MPEHGHTSILGLVLHRGFRGYKSLSSKLDIISIYVFMLLFGFAILKLRGHFIFSSIKWFVFFALFGSWLGYHIIKTTKNIGLGLFVTWIIFGGIYVTNFRLGFYELFPVQDNIRVKAVALMGLLGVIVPIVFMGGLSRNTIKYCFEAMGWVAFIDAVVVIMQWTYEIPVMGLNGNPSLNAGIIATCYPLILSQINHKDAWYYKLALIAIPIFAIMISDASIPFGVLCVATGSYLISNSRNKRGIILAACAAILLSIIIFIAAYFLYPATLFDSSTRFDYWQMFFNYFFEYHSRWLGAGTNTFRFWGPLIQDAYNQAPGGYYYIYMHSDILQILFENGLIGLGLAMLACIDVLRHARNSPVVLSMLLAWLSSAVFNWPGKHPASALVLVLTLAYLYRVERANVIPCRRNNCASRNTQ